MGTSTRLLGPRGADWASARRRLNKWVPEGDSAPGSLGSDGRHTAEELATQFRRALRDALVDDPGRFGLRDAALNVGQRLIDVLDELRHPDPAILRGLPQQDPSAAVDEFVRRFVTEVGGDGRLIVDAVGRRAAHKIAERLVDPTGPLADPARADRVTGELFCTLYQLFFGKMVGEFVHVLIAENVKLAVPALMALDPTDMVAGFVADQVVKLLPDPCDAIAAREPERPRLAEVAQDLLAETVARALGIDEAGLELAA